MGAKDISPEVVKRCIALVRDLAASQTHGCYAVEAREIVALLPESPDPDLLIAREIAVQYGLPGLSGITSYRVNRGEADQISPVRAIFDAIKRGRQLSQDQPS